MERTPLITAVTKCESVIIPDAKPPIRYVIQSQTEAGPLELLMSPQAVVDFMAHLQVLMPEDSGENA